MQIALTINNVVMALVEATVEYVANGPNETITNKLSTSNGQAVFTLPDDTWAITISIYPQNYNDDLVRLYKMGDSSWKVDNPACYFEQRNNFFGLTAIVGRLRPAPTVYIPPDQLPKLAAPPTGVLLHKDNLGFIYHSLFADPYRPFARLKHPILNPKVSQNAQEWQRLEIESVDVGDPKKLGSFFHLEYGDRQSGPRLFLSLYLPSPGERTTLDYIVFFSPSTALENRFPIDRFPFRGNYPYGLTKKTVQEYPRHPQGYLFNGTHLVHQLLASHSKAALIMPVAPYGDWSVFQTRSGLYRLLLECSLFLHREYLTDVHAATRPHLPEYNRAGGSVRWVTGLGNGVASSLFGSFEKIPKLNRVAVAAFSSGCLALQSLLQEGTTPLPQGYPQEYFGASIAAFNRVFAEVWDIDGAHAHYHGYPAFEKALAAWFAKGNRRFRLYHSAYTGGDHDSMSGEALRDQVKPNDMKHDVIVKDKGGQHWAKEHHAANVSWSCVRFANGYLSSDQATNIRPYWVKDDPHHFLPRIAFGHAAYLFGRR